MSARLKGLRLPDIQALQASARSIRGAVPKRQGGDMEGGVRRSFANQALGRLKTGTMNQTESAYEHHLRKRQLVGEIAWYRFEGLTLRLAERCSYTPDFVVMCADGQIELHEVKGSRAIFHDDARVKVRVAAEQFPFRLIAVYPRDRVFSGWDIEEF